MKKKKIFPSLFFLFMFVLCGVPLLGYVGPGAGFAFFTSFLVVFAVVLVGLAVLLTWPIRMVVRTIKLRRLRKKKSDLASHVW